MNESEESASELFEAHSDSAMIFDFHEKAFNKMPFFVVIEIGVPWITAFDFGGMQKSASWLAMYSRFSHEP